MIEVEITIGGHKFRIACAKGEEDQLDTAAKLLDREALALQSVNGRVPETKMLLMAGLMLGDKIKSLEWEKASVQKDLSDYKKEKSKRFKPLYVSYFIKDPDRNPGEYRKTSSRYTDCSHTFPFLRVLFKDGHKVEGNECVVNGKKYELPPDILGNKDKYEFLQWDCELGDAVIFDMRTLHGTLSENIPNKTLSRYTLRVAKEGSKVSYDGDWTSFNYRKAMQEAGYKNGDPVDGEMFPTLYSLS